MLEILSKLRYLRRHAAAYAAAMALLIAVAVVTGDVAWVSWPALVWGFVVIAHYLIAKTLRVDQGWADRRAGVIRSKSYDHGHIEAIEKEYREKSGDD